MLEAECRKEKQRARLLQVRVGSSQFLLHDEDCEGKRRRRRRKWDKQASRSTSGGEESDLRNPILSAVNTKRRMAALLTSQDDGRMTSMTSRIIDDDQSEPRKRWNGEVTGPQMWKTGGPKWNLHLISQWLRQPLHFDILLTNNSVKNF